MTRESNPETSYISDFSTTTDVIDYPEAGVDISELDNAITDAKKMIFNTFPECNGEVEASQTDFNQTDGLTQNLAVIMKGKISSGLATAVSDGSTTDTTYELTTGLDITLADGDRFTFRVDSVNINAAKLKVDDNTAYNLIDYQVNDMITGSIPADAILDVVYDASETRFQIIGGLSA